jgi:hypothetical protein
MTLIVAGVSPAQADELSLLEPINGFSIRNGPHELYGASASGAGWKIAQWNNPLQLGPFAAAACEDKCYVARDDSSQVKLRLGPRFAETSLQQNGRQLACEGRNGKPVEFDLLLSPNNFKSIAADRVRALKLSLEFSVADAHLLENADCRVNQGNTVAALTVRNEFAKPQQVLFYQLSLFNYHVRAKPVGWFAPGVLRRNGASQRFGFRDHLSSYNVAIPQLDQSLSLDIDLLPRIMSIIKSGEHGIDTDLSHWEIRGAYFGQQIWGKAALLTNWRHIALTASVP